MNLDHLHSHTVAEARTLLKKTLKDVESKQAELRELVSVRYRDFIDAADTISDMGGSAKTIIGTAGALGDSCAKLVAGGWKTAGKREVNGKAAAAGDLLTVIQAPENIATSLEQHKILDAAKELLVARERSALYPFLLPYTPLRQANGRQLTGRAGCTAGTGC